MISDEIMQALTQQEITAQFVCSCRADCCAHVEQCNKPAAMLMWSNERHEVSATCSPRSEGCEIGEGLMNQRPCEVCGKPEHYCTNDRCKDCHIRYCTPGGDTSPGHGRRWPKEKKR